MEFYEKLHTQKASFGFALTVPSGGVLAIK
jgi:hypothetical protein